MSYDAFHCPSSWAQPAWQSWEEQDDEPGPPWYIDAHNLTLEPCGVGGHRFTLVLLHSCSGGPDDWFPIIHRLDLPFRKNIRIVVPCAPVRLEEHHGWSGEVNSWFEYTEDGYSAKYPAQLYEQRSRIAAVLREELLLLHDRDPHRIVLAGFSQGVALAIDVALSIPFTLGGVLALRGMVLRESLSLHKHPRPLNVFAFHGRRDGQCPVEEARASYEALRALGAEVHFEVDPWLGHACARGRQRLCRQELRRVSDFLNQLWTGL